MALSKENLTDALADLDAALEKESDRLLASEHVANEEEEGTSKVEELEKQCKCLESQLDEVKGKRSLSFKGFSHCDSLLFPSSFDSIDLHIRKLHWCYIMNSIYNIP